MGLPDLFLQVLGDSDAAHCSVTDLRTELESLGKSWVTACDRTAVC